MAGSILRILNLPEAAAIKQAPPLAWGKRAEFWKTAFKTFPPLAPKKDRACAFMTRVMTDVRDRHIGTHAIWDEFVAGAPEPTAKARMITPRKHALDVIDVADYEISITLLRRGLEEANKLNINLCEFSSFLDSLRPPPAGLHIL